MIPLPAFLASKALQYGLAVLVIALVSVWLAGRVYYNPKLDDAAVKYADLNAEYSAYKAAVAADAARSSAEALEGKKAASDALRAAQEKAAAAQATADAKSAELRRILNSAAPGEVRPIGPNVQRYLDGLRQ